MVGYEVMCKGHSMYLVNFLGTYSTYSIMWFIVPWYFLLLLMFPLWNIRLDPIFHHAMYSSGVFIAPPLSLLASMQPICSGSKGIIITSALRLHPNTSPFKTCQHRYRGTEMKIEIWRGAMVPMCLDKILQRFIYPNQSSFDGIKYSITNQQFYQTFIWELC